MAMMTAEQAAERGKELSFEKVWAMFAESDRKLTERFSETAEQMKETERFLKEQSAQTERFVKERFAETARIVANLSKNVGGLNRSLGELIETLIAADLWKKFPQYGFVRSYRRLPIYDEANRQMTEIDILLSNTDKVMAVEVKHELNKERDVDGHLKRMELAREYPPLEAQGKELLGALAGGVVDPDIARYAYEAGFYVLGLTGETVSLLPPPDGFKPRTW